MSVNKEFDIRFGTHAAPTTLVDRSGNFRSADFNRTIDTFDNTAANQTTNVKSLETGLQEITLSGQMYWTETLDAVLDDLVSNGTEVDYQFGPNGPDTGKVKYTGKMVVTSYSTPIEIGQQMLSTVEMRLNTRTRGVY